MAYTVFASYVILYLFQVQGEIVGHDIKLWDYTFLRANTET